MSQRRPALPNASETGGRGQRLRASTACTSFLSRVRARTTAARREVEELTRQKDAVTTQLGQMLSGLAGIVPQQMMASKDDQKESEKVAAEA